MNNEPQLINAETGEPFEIPVEGNLGLLALGYEGIMLWRMKKREVQEQRNNDE
ncbi:MAG: hypothetical protein AB8G11_24555 [Saprospiraceae bacterium]